MIDVVIKTGSLTSCNARLKQLGIVVNDFPSKVEQTYELVNTPILEDASGDLWFTIRMSEEQAAKLPRNDTPNFAVPWKSNDVTYDTGQVDEEGNPIYSQHPWPMVTVSYPELDENGVPTGVTLERQQGVGKIQ